eukprot:731307-Prymnesium_polylepis.2
MLVVADFAVSDSRAVSVKLYGKAVVGLRPQASAQLRLQLYALDYRTTSAQPQASAHALLECRERS